MANVELFGQCKNSHTFGMTLPVSATAASLFSGILMLNGFAMLDCPERNHAIFIGPVRAKTLLGAI